LEPSTRRVAALMLIDTDSQAWWSRDATLNIA
jgi:hypothetical protein